ncbi:prolyl 4-hydroxylase subunit alpha-1-like isoform X2 [Haliotis rufescens]|uniref:prolyl 4-hydroxylase subunit alpha-1-like isoform X2 n=1 Tax=Haliotis rufescens TaxID=6454 RepID=UPI001EAFA1EB|nr:prolyl 4-hydroxylase subunit alpha-1-like isoform X2 [Haliotis rufescens]WUR08115.1 prolyl 4-hydroxylase subunit alpha [Haliotis discus hannai]
MQGSFSEIVLSFLLIACVANVGRCELFTSMAHLQTALYAERDIAVTLKNYVENEEERLRKIKRLAEDLEAHSIKALEKPDYYLANPVNAFLFVKRFTLDWSKNVDHLLKNDSSESMRRYVEYYRQDLPSYEDLQGSAAALMRLQDTYKLDTSKIAEGTLGGVQSTQLTAAECFELGRFAYIAEDFYHTALWMWQALKLESDEVNKTMERTEILDYLAYALAMKGNVKTALIFTEELLTLEPNHERATNNKRYYEKMLKDKEASEYARGEDGKTLDMDPVENDYRRSHEFQSYEALCRGEQIMEIKNTHKLACRYRTRNNPLLLMMPAKEEDVFLDPWIVMYHDVMSDSEINAVKGLATPKLNRATVQNSKTGELEVATYRISKSAWLKQDEDPVVAKINARMQAITGLSMDTAEELQVANYGLGGHYEPHFDFARKEEKDAFKSLGTGNRIATFLFYMSDVAAGGATVFPYIGVKLFPKKGTAAFWYNLYKNGEGIYNTRHAACPVLVGIKWVSNKWIHERGQEFRRPCGLYAEE